MASVSKVEAELIKALKLKKQKSSEGRDDYLERALKSIDNLDDAGWADLSAAAQKWANDAAKKAKAKKDIPDFPKDAEEEEEDAEEEDGDEADEQEEDGEDEDEKEEEEEEEKPAKKKGGKEKEEKKAPKKEEKKAAPKKKAKDEDEDEEEDGEDEDEDEEDEKPAKTKGGKEKEKEKPAKEEKKAAKSDAPAKAPRGTGVTASIKKIMIADPHITVENLTAKLTKAGFETISNMTVTTVRADFRHTLKIMKEEGGLSKALSSKMDEE